MGKSASRRLKWKNHQALYLRSFFNSFLKYKSLLLNDKWVIELVFPGKRNGFFVEAGASDGVFNSSCYALERHFGWRGICVEPHSRLFHECRRNRPGSVVENAALTDEVSTAVFIEAAATGYSGIKQELQRTEKTAREAGWVKDEWRTSGPYVERRVEALTLHELLKKHHAPRTIDYIAMDIEGSEAAALKDFPFAEYQIGCLSIEGSYCDELLQANGFVMVENKFNRTGPWEHYFVNEVLAAGLPD